MDNRYKKAIVIFPGGCTKNNRGYVSILNEYSVFCETTVVCIGKADCIGLEGVSGYDMTLQSSNRYIRALLTRNVTLLPFFQLLVLVIKNKPNTVYAREIYFLPTLLLIKLFVPSVRLVVDVRESPITHYRGQSFFLRFSDLLIDEMLTNSPLLGEYIYKKYKINKPSVNYEFPAKDFLSSVVIKKDKNPLGVLRLCFFGNVSSDRIIELIVDAVNMSEAKVRLDVYGEVKDPEYVEYLKGLDVKNRVVFHGLINYLTAPKILSSYDCGVLLNEINDNSVVTIPGKFWEYISCGLCVLSNDRPTVSSVILKENIGFISDDSIGLMNAIDLLVSDPVLLATLKKNSPEFVS